MIILNWLNNIEKLVKVDYNIFNPPLLVNINEKYF